MESPPSAGAIQGHPRRSVSFTAGQRGVQTRWGGGFGGWRVRSSHPAGLLLRSGAGNLDRKLDLCPAEPGQRGGEAARSLGSQRGRGAELRMTNMFSLIHSFCFSSECLFTPCSPTVLIHFSVISLVCLDSSGRFIDSIVIGAYQQKYSFTP